jgi:predicted permease
MLTELRLATRSLLRQPSFTIAAAGTLALGIAASTAVFSTVNAALLQPLPYPDAKNIHSLRTTITDGRYTSGLVGPAELFDLAAATDDIVAGGLALRVHESLTTEGGATQVVLYGVSRDFFRLFGARMALGREFDPREYEPGPPRAVVLSHRAWRRYFGGDPAIVGQKIHISGGHVAVPVVGVAAQEFDFPGGAEIWFAMHMRPDDVSHLFEAYIRLRPEATIEAVAGPMARVMADLAVKHPDQNKNRAFVATPLLETVVGDLGPVLLIALAATGLLLLIAAVNVTNLMLARAAGRGREMAVRAALGASRLRLARQLLLESSVLAAAGGIAGIAGAFAAVRALGALGAADLPRLTGLTFDLNVLAFAAAAVGVAALAVGVIPAVVTARADLMPVINEGGRSSSGGTASRRVLAGLIVAEIAVAIALVAGAGRIVRSFENLSNEDRGFTFGPRLIADVSLPFMQYREPARVQAWVDEAGARLAAAGLTRVATVSSFPLRTEWDTTSFIDLVRDPSTDPHARPNARLRRVSAGFFEIMDIPLVAGRAFSPQDRDGTQPVAIVSQAFVDRFLQGRDPLQEQITTPNAHTALVDGRWQSRRIQIVGVAADVRHAGLGQAPEQTVYVAQTQAPARRFSLVADTAGADAGALAGAARDALSAIDPRVPVDVTTLSEVVDASLSRQRLGMTLMSIFGVAALALAAVGVFGVIAFVVAQRTGEMAVRLALGASTGRIFWIVMRQGAALTAAGVALGLVLAWWTGGLVAAYVYRVTSLDPAVIGGSVLSVGLVALTSTQILARRASAINPSRALRG